MPAARGRLTGEEVVEAELVRPFVATPEGDEEGTAETRRAAFAAVADTGGRVEPAIVETAEPTEALPAVRAAVAVVVVVVGRAEPAAAEGRETVDPAAVGLVTATVRALAVVFATLTRPVEGFAVVVRGVPEADVAVRPAAAVVWHGKDCFRRGWVCSGEGSQSVLGPPNGSTADRHTFVALRAVPGAAFAGVEADFLVGLPFVSSSEDGGGGVVGEASADSAGAGALEENEGGTFSISSAMSVGAMFRRLCTWCTVRRMVCDCCDPRSCLFDGSPPTPLFSHSAGRLLSPPVCLCVVPYGPAWLRVPLLWSL